MKLDKDLIRAILLAVEADEGDPREWKTIEIPGYSREQIAYHVCILAEAGFIEAKDLSSNDGYDWRAIRLTYEGHEFLDTIRDGEIWRLTKETAKSAGVTSVKVLFEVGKAYAKQKLIEHGVHIP
jgi:hypothetical protein